jgi:hypothetical protein
MKWHPFRNDSGRDIEKFHWQRSAQQLSPGNGAHCERLPLLKPLPKLPILWRFPHERENHETGVKMDHRVRRLALDAAGGAISLRQVPKGCYRAPVRRRRAEARRSERTWRRQRSAAVDVSFSERCNTSSAVVGSAAPGSRTSAAIRIARRNASDFDTRQRWAIESSLRTLSTSSEYVDLIVVMAIRYGSTMP